MDSNIRTVNIFDVFEGGNLPDDKKSIAINVSIQADDKTLSDSDQIKLVRKLLKKKIKQAGTSGHNVRY